MYIQLNGQILYYETYGEGKPLILLHGNGESHEIFEELSDALKDEFLIYAIDTRGHGNSATPKEYHYIDMANDLSLLVNSLGIDHPIVLGFSDGAVAALLYAITDSAKLSGLILCGANLSPKGLSNKALRQIKRDYKKTSDPLTYLMLVEPNINQADLSHISVPTYVCAGEHDIIKEKETDAIAASIPNSKKIIYKDCDHGSYVVHDARLAPVIRELSQSNGNA